MMIRIPTNFELSQYGLHCRLVCTKDATFILSLRTNALLSQYLHKTDNNIDKQIKWISDYKQREAAGIEYYFIFFHEDIPIGVCRIYNIHDKTGTVGSWICSTDVSEDLPILTLIITRNILFEILGAEYDFFDVRKNNKKVWKMHLMFGANIVDENEEDLFLLLKKDDYIYNRDNILNLYIV